MGEALLKQNLMPALKMGSNFQKVPDKVPLNELVRMKVQSHTSQTTLPKLAGISLIIFLFHPQPEISFNSADAINASNLTLSSASLDSDLLMQSPIISASKESFKEETISSAPLGDTIDLLIPLSDQPAKQFVSDAQSSALDGDVSMLDSGNTNDISSGINDDVQLLHSPVEKPQIQIQVTAPSLAEISVKLEDIKPSIQSTVLWNSRIECFSSGSKPPITLLAQDSGVNLNLHSATAQVPEVTHCQIYYL